MENIDFLHDAILEQICINWAESAVSITCIPNEFYKLKKTKVTFLNVKNIIISHFNVWGGSSFINGIAFEINCAIIEMQSGDKIKIEYLEPLIKLTEVID